MRVHTHSSRACCVDAQAHAQARTVVRKRDGMHARTVTYARAHATSQRSVSVSRMSSASYWRVPVAALGYQSAVVVEAIRRGATAIAPCVFKTIVLEQSFDKQVWLAASRSITSGWHTQVCAVMPGLITRHRSTTSQGVSCRLCCCRGWRGGRGGRRTGCLGEPAHRLTCVQAHRVRTYTVSCICVSTAC